jgi:uncharacterized caspase-like protein
MMMCRFRSLPPISTAFGRVVLAFLVAFVVSTSAALAGPRLALVVGNSNYKNVPTLPNPKNDSVDVANAFIRLGFKVTQLADATIEDLRIGLRNFSHEATGAEIAVVYYAGHGVEVGGTNWLIPTDASLRSDADVDKEAISLDAVLRSVEEADFSLVILDACRNNPFPSRTERLSQSRGVDRGLARVRPIANVLVAYAAKDGTTADDGKGRNSPYTGALLANLETPGLEIDLMFRRVRDRVMKETNGRQQPFTYGLLSKQAIYLKPPTIAAGIAPPPPAPAPNQNPAGSGVACDVLAASKFDKDRPESVAGVDAEKIDVIPALAACEAAIRQFPQVARYYFQQGRVALALKNYQRADDLLRKASDLGSSSAMYTIGVAYLHGLGFDRNPGNARTWLKKSVDLGNTHAMAALGLLYSETADGFKTDDAQALRLFQQAAAAGEPVAMNGLGVFYETGRMVMRDYDAARSWYQKAADLGNEIAMRNLGALYERGTGVPKSSSLARHWYEQSAAAGDLEAKNRLRVLK